MVLTPSDTGRWWKTLFRQVYGHWDYYDIFNSFASAHSGGRYLIGDEPDNSTSAASFAAAYCAIAHNTLNVDPSATFAPMALMNPPEFQSWHDDFSAAIHTNCADAPVAEWNYDMLYGWHGGTSLDSLKADAERHHAWAQAHGDAPIVISDMTLDWHGVCDGGLPDGDPTYIAKLRALHNWLARPEQSYILSTRSFTFEQYGLANGSCGDVNAHPLGTSDGTLTPEGIALAGYLADGNHWIGGGEEDPDNGNVLGGITFGKVYWQNDVWMNDVQYFSAVGMHGAGVGPSWATFRIPKGAKGFTTVFGQARQDGNSCSTVARGSIYADNVRIWSQVISGNWSNAAVTATVALPANATVLKLAVDSVDSYVCANTTWGDPHYLSSSDFRLYTAVITGQFGTVPYATACQWVGSSTVPNANRWIWTVDGVVVSTQQTLTYTNHGDGFDLALVVGNDMGDWSKDSGHVSVATDHTSGSCDP
jgi:hypothetical protein